MAGADRPHPARAQPPGDRVIGHLVIALVGAKLRIVLADIGGRPFHAARAERALLEVGVFEHGVHEIIIRAVLQMRGDAAELRLGLPARKPVIAVKTGQIALPVRIDVGFRQRHGDVDIAILAGLFGRIHGAQPKTAHIPKGGGDVGVEAGMFRPGRIEDQIGEAPEVIAHRAVFGQILVGQRQAHPALGRIDRLVEEAALEFVERQQRSAVEDFIRDAPEVDVARADFPLLGFHQQRDLAPLRFLVIAEVAQVGVTIEDFLAGIHQASSRSTTRMMVTRRTGTCSNSKSGGAESGRLAAR